MTGATESATDTQTLTEHESEQIERANASTATPVVFIHGLWLLPSSWDRWATLFEEAGYVALGDRERVLQEAAAQRGRDRDRRDPEPRARAHHRQRLARGRGHGPGVRQAVHVAR